MLRKLFLIALLAFQSSASGDEPAKSGIVHFNVVDAYGNSLLPSEIKVTNKQDARQTTVSNIAIQTLPYGEYEVRVLVPGFAYWFRTINVDKPDSNIPVGMLAGAMEGRPPTCSVSGTIKGLRREVFAAVGGRGVGSSGAPRHRAADDDDVDALAPQPVHRRARRVLGAQEAQRRRSARVARSRVARGIAVDMASMRWLI